MRLQRYGKHQMMPTLPVTLFGPSGLFMSKMPTYAPEGGNERRKVTTPTSISLIDSYEVKSL